MRVPNAVAGALIVALATGVPGCDGVSAPVAGGPEEGERTRFVARLVVDTAQGSYWLQPGDTISVRLRVTPDPGMNQGGRNEGTLGYDGIPVWSPTRASPAVFEASYFTHPDLGHRLISVFWGENVSGARMVLFLDSDPLAIDWVITANGAQGELIEVASGTGIVL